MHDRPLLCAALKPLGLSPVQLAGVARGFARAGIDIIKDDHSLSDQPSAPFRERVARCQEAVAAANRETGGRALYFPNVTSAPLEMSERAVLARRAGCRGVVVNALPAGLGAVRALAAGDDAGLAIMSHPSLAGAFFHPHHGIAPAVLLGDLFRLVGSDAVIYPILVMPIANDAVAYASAVASSGPVTVTDRTPVGALPVAGSTTCSPRA